MRFEATPRLGLYASIGRMSREPARSDMLNGEDNASLPYDLERGRARAGGGLRGRRRAAARAARRCARTSTRWSSRTRSRSRASSREIGLPVRRNAGRSHRRGVELDARLQPDTAPAARRERGLEPQPHRRLDAVLRRLRRGRRLDLFARPSCTTTSRRCSRPQAILNGTLEWKPTPRDLAAGGGPLRGRGAARQHRQPRLPHAGLLQPRRCRRACRCELVAHGEPRIRVQATNLLDDRRMLARRLQLSVLHARGRRRTRSAAARTTIRRPRAACTRRWTCASEELPEAMSLDRGGRRARSASATSSSRSARAPGAGLRASPARSPTSCRLPARPLCRARRRCRPSSESSASTGGGAWRRGGDGQGPARRLEGAARGAGRARRRDRRRRPSRSACCSSARTSRSLPFWDGGLVAASLAAQWMAARKWLENWLVWIGVNVVSVGVFVSQQLHLTTALYAALPGDGVRRLPRVDALRTVAERREAGARRADRARVHRQDLARGRARRALRGAVVARVRARVRRAPRRAARLRRRRPDRPRAAAGRGRRDRAGRGRERGPRRARHRPPEHGGLQPPLLRRLPGLDRGARPRGAWASSTCSTTSTCPGSPTAASASSRSGGPSSSSAFARRSPRGRGSSEGGSGMRGEGVRWDELLK